MTSSKAHTGRRHPKISADLIVGLLNRLTDRDREILHLVWEHRVLTTSQLTAIFFHSPNTARQRLNQLHQLDALVRFRPRIQTGTLPHHWALGPAGAHVIAAQQGVDIKDLRYRLDATMRFFLSQNLSHQVGVNDFFARLHAHARHDPGAELAEWWHERRCARLWGEHAQPDAFGRWSETTGTRPPDEIDFFLEHDTGTEPLARVAAKLSGYANLTESTSIATPILFWLPSIRREANLRRILGTPQVAVATAVTSAAGPADAVWLPAGSTGPRRRLATLADAWKPPAQPRGAGT